MAPKVKSTGGSVIRIMIITIIITLVVIIIVALVIIVIVVTIIEWTGALLQGLKWPFTSAVPHPCSMRRTREPSLEMRI